MMAWIISASILILIIVLIRALTRGRISMRLRYALWALVLVRLLIPFNFGSTSVSIMNTAQQVPVIQDVQILEDIQYIEHCTDGTVEGYHQSDYLSDSPTILAENKSDEDFVRMSAVLNLQNLLIPIWKFGVLAMLLVFLLANLRFRRSLRENRTQLETEEFPLPVYVTTSVETPCLFGLIRPSVYVTPEVQNDPKALHYALEHELTHYYQGDFIWSFLRCICLSLHWFNPLVWLAVHLSRQDAELSCDEGTIRRIGENHRVEYGNTLIDLTCAQPHAGAFFYTATTMTGNIKDIRERVTFIAKKPRNLAVVVLIVTLVTAISVGCTFTGANKQDANNTEQVALTEDEIAFFEDTFFSSDSIAPQFLNSLYTSPENINLFDLFYNGTYLPGAIDTEELRALSETYPDIWDNIDCTKIPAKDIDAILEKYTGLKLKDTQKLGMEHFTYLKQYDAYYHFHGDTNARGLDIIAGYRQGDCVYLYYDENKMVTLKEVENGWHILSNQYAPMPTLAVQLPEDTDPFLTVPVDSFSTVEPQLVKTESFTRQEWGQLVDKGYAYPIADGAPNREIMAGVWPDGAVYACYVVYDNEGGEDTYYRFAKLCDASYTEEMLNSDYPGTLVIQPYTDFLGYNGFSLFCPYSQPVERHYTFSPDGRLMQLLESSSTIDRQFTAGGRTFAFDAAGGLEKAHLWVRDGDTLRAVSLAELLEQELPAPAQQSLIQVDDRGVGIITYYDATNAYLPRLDVRVACDGKNLYFYHGNGKTYTDGISNDIHVPDAVLNQAKEIAQSQLMHLQEMMPTLNTWRISKVILQEAKPVDGVTIELYAPWIEFCAAGPTDESSNMDDPDRWISVDGDAFEYASLILRNTQTGRCMIASGDPNSYNTIDTLLIDSPQLRPVLTYVAELWGVQEGDNVELILRQSPGYVPSIIRLQTGHWDIPDAETYFRHLAEINWVPADPIETPDGAAVTLATQQFNLTAYEGTTTVKRLNSGNTGEWLKPDSDDYFDKPYEFILRSWFDDLEYHTADKENSLFVSDRGQSWQEAAAELAAHYSDAMPSVSHGSQHAYTFLKAVAEPSPDTTAALQEQEEIGKETYCFYLTVIFVPENQRALTYAMPGNTSEYTGRDPSVPDGAYEYLRTCTITREADGWHGEIHGTGW